LVRNHHRRWNEWDESIDHPLVFGSQALFLADWLERSIARDRFILHHHEKLNGSGYPFRRTETALDIGARIMAVADVFTALAEDRPYRPGMDDKRIAGILRDMAQGGSIDTRIVDLLLENQGEIRRAVRDKQDEAASQFEREFAVANGTHPADHRHYLQDVTPLTVLEQQ